MMNVRPTMNVMRISAILFQLGLLHFLFTVTWSQPTNRSCSYQIKEYVPLEGCTIYNLSGCPKDVWSAEFVSNGLKNSFPLEIDISSYVYSGAQILMSAVNITFAIKDDRVASFAVRFLNGCEDRVPICRYYDFHSVNRSLLQKSVLFNDDVFFRVQYTQSDCNVEFVALSSDGRSLGFKQVNFKIPDRDGISNDNLTLWQSLIVVDKTSYFDDAINVSFTTAPSYANVLSYVLQLVKVGSGTVSCRQVSSRNRVVHFRMENIQSDLEYFVRIAPVVNSCSCVGHCLFTESSRFIPYQSKCEFKFLKDFHSVLLCFVTLILIVMLVMYLIFARRQRLKIPEFESIVSVLIVYSHDSKNHKKVVEAMANFLKVNCACAVRFDKWDIKNKDPQAWLDESILVADYILIVWSQGAHLILSDKNTKVLNNEPGYIGDLFHLAMFKINAAIAEELKKPRKIQKLDRFCHVILPYVSSNAVVPGLRSLATFKLPFHMNQMLCHLHCIKPISVIPFTKRYPLFSVSNLALSGEGIELLKTIDLMKGEVLKNCFGNAVVDYTDNPLIRNLRFPMKVPECNDSISNLNDSMDVATSCDTDVPMVDCDFHVEDLPIFGERNCGTNYYLHDNQHVVDDEQRSGSRRPLVNVADYV